MKRWLWASGLLLLLASTAALAAKTDVPLDARTATTAECSLGNLVADAVRVAFNADLALVNASQLRAVSFPAGEINLGEVSGALVYPSEKVALAEIKGDKLLAALERSVSISPQANHGFLQVSGVRFSFRPSLPAGSRVQGVTVNGQPLNRNATYRVALPESLAKGAQGYSRVFNGLLIKQTDGKLSQALTSYLNGNPTVDIKPGQRIQKQD